MKAKSKDSGKLRIGDDWNAIRIIALSQSNPLKAIAEFVENASMHMQRASRSPAARNMAHTTSPSRMTGMAYPAIPKVCRTSSMSPPTYVIPSSGD